MIRQTFLRVADFSNLCFAFFGLQLANGLFVYLTKWYYILIFALTVAANSYVCYIILKMKNYVVRYVMDGFDRHDNDPEHREKVESVIQQRLQWGDLGELAFGRLGRYVVDSTLIIAVFTMAVGQMFSLRYPLMNSPSNETWHNITFTPYFTYTFQLGSLSTFVKIFLPLLTLSAIFPGYRSVGIFSFVGIAILFLRQVFVYIPLMMNFYPIDEFGKFRNLKRPEWTSSCIPQISVLMLMIHGSFRENRRYFMIVLHFAVMLSTFPVLLSISARLYAYLCNPLPPLDPGNLANQAFFGNIMWLRITVIYCGLALCFMLNFPLSNVIERMLSNKNMRSSNGNLEDISILSATGSTNSSFTDIFFRKSIFDQLRNDPDSTLSAAAILSDLEMNVPYWKKFIIRLFFILGEFGCTVLAWHCTAFNTAISYLEATSNAFMGFIIPLAISLRLQWADTPTYRRIVPVIIMAFTVVLSYSVVAGFFMNFK